MLPRDQRARVVQEIWRRAPSQPLPLRLKNPATMWKPLALATRLVLPADAEAWRAGASVFARSKLNQSLQVIPKSA